MHTRPQSLQNIKPGAHIHLMGICGTAMASLAGLLKDRGFKVTGSDLNPYPPMSTQLEKLGITIQKPYQASNLNPRPDFVVVGNVISANNPEAQELLRLEIPYTSLPQALGEVIIADRASLVVAGTHGKTTTTSMLAWVTTQLKLKPGFLIGGIPKNFSQSFKNPEGGIFVIEGDEYDTAYFDKVPKFTHYKPKHTILTSIEFDHADIYENLAAVKSAFAKLVGLIPKDGHLVCWGEDPNIAELMGRCQGKLVTYGLKNGDYQAEVLDSKTKGFTEFAVWYKRKRLAQYKLQLSGEYNVLNATAVIALCHEMGWDIDIVRTALEKFEGVKRRQEILGEPGGILVIEDFAHHPTAVRETIRGIRKRYSERPLWAVFEPRSATSRRKIFQKDYAEAFSEAQHTLIMQAFDQSKISETDRFSS